MLSVSSHMRHVYIYTEMNILNESCVLEVAPAFFFLISTPGFYNVPVIIYSHQVKAVSCYVT